MLFSQLQQKEVNVNCDYWKTNYDSGPPKYRTIIDINMMYITTFWLYTNSLHLERSSTAHAAWTNETRCSAVIDCVSAAVIVIFFFAFWCAAPTWVRCCTARLLCFLIVGNQASGISIYSVAHVPVDVVIVKSYHDLQSNLLVRTPL